MSPICEGNLGHHLIRGFQHEDRFRVFGNKFFKIFISAASQFSTLSSFFRDSIPPNNRFSFYAEIFFCNAFISFCRIDHSIDSCANRQADYGTELLIKMKF